MAIRCYRNGVHHIIQHCNWKGALHRHNRSFHFEHSTWSMELNAIYFSERNPNRWWWKNGETLCFSTVKDQRWASLPWISYILFVKYLWNYQECNLSWPFWIFPLLVIEYLVSVFFCHLAFSIIYFPFFAMTPKTASGQPQVVNRRTRSQTQVVNRRIRSYRQDMTAKTCSKNNAKINKQWKNK